MVETAAYSLKKPRGKFLGLPPLARSSYLTSGIAYGTIRWRGQMGKFEKLVEKIRRGAGDISFDDLDLVLTRLGYTCKHESDNVYRQKGRTPIIIGTNQPRPHPKAVKDVRRAIEDLLDEE